MKKLSSVIMAILLTVVMLFGIVGCGNGTQNVPDGSDDTIGSGQETPVEDDGIYGAFYTVQEAYDRGYITKTDIQDAVYYYRHAVYEVESIDKWDERVEIDYTPTKPAPSRFLETFNSELDRKIKSSYFELYKYKFYSDGKQTSDPYKLTIWFFGEYNGSYIVRIYGPGAYGSDILNSVVAGVGWTYDGFDISVFRLN